ncbi:hypothetical protein [Marinibacterium profundimaris]|uniref:Methyl-accepting transducer domain-containing protein n=1 Tax=Marinibacterium profundimaris TaxID=1679460 RepID=A0A225NIA1_9RHOB|nr:hypothetical protein [Marinibacterium profundimaris]OWU73463.1 hypothetical protein ATO3_12390 [Marinibacterium profundimaris]
MVNSASPASGAHEVLAGCDEEIRAVEAVFTEAADALASGQAQILDLVGVLGSYRDGLMAMSAEDIAAAVKAMARQFAGTREAFGRECSAISEIESNLQTAMPPLARLQDRVQTLQVFTSTARVVEEEFGLDGEHAFSHKIRELTASSRTGYEELHQHSQAILGQTREVRAGQASFAEAGLDALASLSADLLDLAETIVPRLNAAKQDADHVAGVTTQLSDLMSRAISALQVGDSFRQRLEHARAGIASCPPRREAPEAHDLIMLLVSAQLFAAGRALGTDLDRVSMAMSEVSAKTGGLVEWGRSHLGGSDIADLLQSLQDLCGSGLSKLYASQAERRILDGKLRKLRHITGNMQRVMAEQSAVDIEMKLGSYNVSLRSRASTEKGAAISYVAKQISELVDHCLAARQDIVVCLEMVRSTIVGTIEKSEGSVADELDDIGDRLAGLGRMMCLWRDFDHNLRATTEIGPSAIADFSRCAQQMRAQQSAARSVQGLAEALSDGLSPSDAPALLKVPQAREAAEALRAVYSVPEEREIHDNLCRGSADIPAPANNAETEQESEEEFEWF